MSDDDRALARLTRPRGVPAIVKTTEDTPIGMAVIDDTGAHSVLDAETAEDAAKRTHDRIKKTAELAGETQQIAADTSARVDDANTGITTLQTVVLERLDSQDARIEKLDEKVDGVEKKVDKVADVVLEGMAAELDRRRDADHVMMRQQTQIGTASDIAALEVAAAREKTAEVKKRTSVENRAKFVAVLASIATFIMALLEARHC